MKQISRGARTVLTAMVVLAGFLAACVSTPEDTSASEQMMLDENVDLHDGYGEQLPAPPTFDRWHHPPIVDLEQPAGGAAAAATGGNSACRTCHAAGEYGT